MKLKIMSAVLAALIAVSLTSCGKEESSSESTAETTAVTDSADIESESETDPQNLIMPRSSAYGLVIENSAYGYRFSPPEGINSEDGSTAQTGSVSTSKDLYMLSSLENHDNMNVSVAEIVPQADWTSYTKESIQNEMTNLYESIGMATSVEVSSLEKLTIAGFDAYKIVTNGKNENGTEFVQTQIMINRNDDTPYCYTFTYTNYSGNLDIEDSINSIEFIAASGPAVITDEHEGEPFVFSCGLEFTAPEGWELITNSSEISHEVTGSEIEFTTPEGDASVYVTVSDTADDESAFVGYTQSDVEEMFFAGAAVDSYESKSFDSLTVEGYNAHKYKYAAKMGNYEYVQTVLMINCPDINKGVCLILSDFSGNAEEVSAKLESTVKFK